MDKLSGDSNDRDSPAYKQNVRDLEYQSVLDTARENLELGVSCVLPAPWTKEVQLGQLTAEQLKFPSDTRVMVVWLVLAPSQRKARVQRRAHPRDAYKLNQWTTGEGFSPDGCVLQLDAARPVTELTASLSKTLCG